MMNSKALAKELITLCTSPQSEKTIPAFFDLLKKKNLLSLLPQIKGHVVRLSKEREGYDTLVIRSRYPLSSKELSEIKKIVGAPEDALVEASLDEAMIASFEVSYRGTLYDSSLKGAVAQLEKTLSV